MLSAKGYHIDEKTKLRGGKQAKLLLTVNKNFKILLIIST